MPHSMNGLVGYTQAVKSYRHEINADETATLCGITANDTNQDLPIACGCKNAMCQLPVTCPVCLSAINKVGN